MLDVEKALLPDQTSVIAYAGKVKQVETVSVFLEDGTAVTKDVTIFISWESIQELLGLIRKRAGIPNSVVVFNQNNP